MGLTDSNGTFRKREHMGTWLGRAALTGILVTLAMPATAGAGARSVTKVRGEVLPGLTHAQDLGALSPGKRIVVAITVQKNLPALYRAEWALYNPHSPSYHHFLTPDEYRHRYGTSPTQVAAIRSFATSQGLRLVNPNVLYDYVELSGTVRQVEATFGVQLSSFSEGSRKFFANLQNPSVPAGLGIQAVLGLESFDRYQAADLHRTVDARTQTMTLSAAQKQLLARAPVSGPATPEAPKTTQGQGQCDPTGTGCAGLLSPQDLWTAYEMPTDPNGPANSSADFGQGQTIGIIGEGQTQDVIAALREFESTRKLPQIPVQVYHTDPGEIAAENTLDDSGRIEWELDSQASTGMAPDVSQLRMYFGSSLALTELTGAIGTWVNDPQGPLQASASLGACEDNPALHPLLGAAQLADEALLIQAADEGRTLFASTGDTGAGCSEAVSENGIQYGPIPTDEYPSVDPNAVGVGGTILYTQPNGSRELERAWDHTGGGPSHFIAQPPYQNGASPLLGGNACVTDESGNAYSPGQLCRGVADVAAESGDITISADHRIGDLSVTGGYDPRTSPVQANGYDMVDFCPTSELATGNAAEPNCAYDANGASIAPTTEPTDPGTCGNSSNSCSESGYMTDHFSEGGTSLSSPLWLGIWARVQAHHDAVDPQTLIGSSSLGFANPLIYKLAQGAKTSDDFSDVTVGANPLPAGPGYDFPTGWGSPNVSNLIADATGDGKTDPASDVKPSGADPTPAVAQPPHGPACTYAFYDGSADAPDGFTGQQDNQLDFVQGTLGLTPDRTKLRVVMNILDLSKTIPTGSNYLDYELFWNFTPAGASSPTTFGVDVQVDSSGNVTYQDGTETVTTTQGATNYQFNPSSSSGATGTFGSGPNGAIEVDVPLKDIGSPALGDVLAGPGGYTADGVNAQVTGVGFIADQDGPGNSYTLGEPTCIDPGPSSSTGPSGSGSTGSSGGSGSTGSSGGSSGSSGSSGGSSGSGNSAGSPAPAGSSGPAGPAGPAGATGGSQPAGANAVRPKAKPKAKPKPKHKAKHKAVKHRKHKKRKSPAKKPRRAKRR
jgi:hypothetical protein